MGEGSEGSGSTSGPTLSSNTPTLLWSETRAQVGSARSFRPVDLFQQCQRAP